MGRSFSSTRSRSNSVVVSSLNAAVQAQQIQNTVLNGVIQGKGINVPGLV